MGKAFFIAGTDTSVGKTHVSCVLLAAAKARGLRTLAIKPVAAGCEETPEGWRNEDALALQAAMTLPLRYSEINPVALPLPLSPHLAAAAAGRRLSITQLAGFCRGTLMQRADFALVEGAGGWRTPVSERELLSALPRELGLPVVLVVGMRLGCLNHAILTAEAILKDGLRLAGWVANVIDPEMAALDDNIATLERLLPAPCLGRLPWAPDTVPSEQAGLLDIAPLLPALG
ncbi:MAG: dethiobiotin synthase [Moraxellaceae bacterium]|nr:dethiobiotin synthase [Moraxellaceae bacterium]